MEKNQDLILLSCKQMSYLFQMKFVLMKSIKLEKTQEENERSKRAFSSKQSTNKERKKN